CASAISGSRAPRPAGARASRRCSAGSERAARARKAVLGCRSPPTAGNPAQNVSFRNCVARRPRPTISSPWVSTVAPAACGGPVNVSIAVPLASTGTGRNTNASARSKRNDVPTGTVNGLQVIPKPNHAIELGVAPLIVQVLATPAVPGTGPVCFGTTTASRTVGGGPTTKPPLVDVARSIGRVICAAG